MSAPSSSAKTRGTVFLVPSTLDFGVSHTVPLQDVLPARSLQVSAQLQHWVCEDAKSTRAFLKRVHEIYPLAVPLQAQQIQELPHEVHKKGDHGGNFDARSLLAPALQGHDMGLISEAGMPAVADPGSSVVRAAHDLGLKVVPLVGPVSLLLGLAASGLNGQNFAFVGYLPQDAAQRSQRIRELEGLALKTGQTQLFIETPYRNPAMLDALLQALKPLTRLAISSGLTLEHAQIRSDSVQGWKQRASTLDKHTPAVFAIGV
jgi:16S rRNA (cytidine1402-2'-O)-methyltransferase